MSHDIKRGVSHFSKSIHPAFESLMEELELLQKELERFERESDFNSKMDALMKEYHKDKHYKALLETDFQ